MCGLVGIAGNLMLSDEGAMKRLLLFDYIRGQDATGLAAVRGNGDVFVAKIASDPITLFDSQKFKDTNSANSSKVFIGHNRWATRGGKSNYNAHPFEYDHIVCAHNGTLDAKSWNDLEAAVGEKFEVDSQALVAAIAKLGIREAIEICREGADDKDGAWALTWYDSIEGSLNFLRNKHRPMYFCYDKDFKRVYWASEWWMLQAALERTGVVELYEEKATGYKYFPTEPDLHYKFDVSAIMAGGKKPKPKVTTIKGKEPLPVVKTPVQGSFPTRPHGSVCGFQSAKVDDKGNVTTLTPTNAGTTRRSLPDNVLHWLGNIHNPLAGVIDEKQFEQLAQYGCSWCGDPIFYGDPGVTVYERDQMILCNKPTCSGHETANDDTASRIYMPGPAFEALFS